MTSIVSLESNEYSPVSKRGTEKGRAVLLTECKDLLGRLQIGGESLVDISALAILQNLFIITPYSNEISFLISAEA